MDNAHKHYLAESSNFSLLSLIISFWNISVPHAECTVVLLKLVVVPVLRLFHSLHQEGVGRQFSLPVVPGEGGETEIT